MAKHRTHSIAFKRQVVQEYLAGETLHGLARYHDLSRALGCGAAAVGCCRGGCAGGGTDGDRAGRWLAGDRRPGGGRFGADAGAGGSGAPMIPVPGGVRVWLASGHAARHEHPGPSGPGGCGGDSPLPTIARPTAAPRRRDHWLEWIPLFQPSMAGLGPAGKVLSPETGSVARPPTSSPRA